MMPAAAAGLDAIYIAYLRRSLDQLKQADSLTRQENVIRAWCYRHGIEWSRVDVVVEPDNTTRDDYAAHGEWHAKILPRTAKGVHVLVEERSRVGADIDYVMALRDLTVRGAQLIVCSTDERPKWRGGMDDVAEAFHACKNKQEVLDTRARTRRGLRDLVERGYWVSLCPYGYVLVPDESSRDKKSDRCHVWLRQNPTTAVIVVRIYAMYVAGAGPLKIARTLNAEGIAGPGGRAWQSSVIWKILRNRIYRGVVIHGATHATKRGGKWVVSKESDPSQVLRFLRPELALIEPALADAVDAASSARTKERPARHVKHPVSSFGRCAKCKGAIAVVSSGPRKHSYYVCQRSRRHGTCDIKARRRVELVEAAIVHGLQQEIFSTEQIEMIRSSIRASVAAEAERQRGLQGADLGLLEAELVEARAEKARAMKLALALDDDADVVDLLRRVKARIGGLEAQIAGAKRACGLDEITARRIEEEAVRGLESAREAIETREQLRDALKGLFPRGLLFHDDGARGWIITGDVSVRTFESLASPKNLDVRIPFRVRVAA